ncbi:Potassium voltage-gated channel subfamily KQT [Fulvivirga imtechensis AK7]|uniref:Potassium voltage-gated channel subfamily KQT n=1 Tax=Fulvivirga imtechensis AK7 TaxID=1237149 RepID=L8JTG0_9BACT|nr:ion transporter [Fulvivirga imtechensis]ELR72251.1 Potassium voltage-gated channel subfamily KQT [Fulvivirga imtechensis AK7]
MKLLRRLNIIVDDSKHTKGGRLYNQILIVLITLNVCVVIIESFSLPSYTRPYLKSFEVFSIVVFTLDYLVRIVTARIRHKKLNGIKSYLRFIISPLGLIDLLSILPFYLPLLLPIDLRFLRLLRVFRIMRVFKLNRYYKSFRLILHVINIKKRELTMCLFAVIILLVIASAIMFYIENPKQPDKFPNIIASLWWAIATLTTIGYGDVYPITAAGKVVSSFIALVGIGFVALPTGILSSGFLEVLDEKRKFNYCPHCGEKLPC